VQLCRTTHNDAEGCAALLLWLLVLRDRLQLCVLVFCILYGVRGKTPSLAALTFAHYFGTDVPTTQ